MPSEQPPTKTPSQMTDKEFRSWLLQGGEDELPSPFLRAPEKPPSKLIEQLGLRPKSPK